MKPITAKQKEAILRSFRAVFKFHDIAKLTKAGYNFIYLAGGFIAHYDIEGFRSFYYDPMELALDIVGNSRLNQWDNFSPSDEHYAYYMSKREVYNEIEKLAVAYFKR